MQNYNVGLQLDITNALSPVKSVPLVPVLMQMAESERLKKITERVHNAETKEQRNEIKKQLPAIIISADTTCRKPSDNDTRNPLIYIDLDLKDHPDTDIEKAVDSMSYKWLIGHQSSPSKGVKVLCGIEPNTETHQRSFKALEKAFAEHGLIADGSCKDLKRLTYLNYDPDIERTLIEPLMSWDGTTIEPLEDETAPLLTSADQVDPITFADATPQRPLEDAIEALRAIKDAIGRPKYETWLELLSGMFNSYGMAGYNAVKDIIGGDGYDQKPPKDLLSDITAGSVFHRASQLRTSTAPVESNAAKFKQELKSMIASTPEHIRKMESQAREAVFVLPRIACAGDLTIINARFSTGKTLLTLWLLSERDIVATKGMDIYYINADDSYNGAVEKAILVESIGVNELVPGQAGFTTDKLKWIIQSAIKTDTARDIVIVLDTLKKFVDTMDKREARSLNLMLREFSGCGGTVIALAHTNKHKIGGESVAEGVGDFLSDFDCAYLMDEIEPTPENVKTIVLKNQKLRNPNAKEVHLTYDSSEGKTWRQRFDSVEMVGSDEVKAVCAETQANEKHSEDMWIIQYLEQRIYSSSEPVSSTALCQQDLDGDTPSRGQRERVLCLYADTNPRELHRHWRQRKLTNKKGIFYTPPEKIEPF